MYKRSGKIRGLLGRETEIETKERAKERKNVRELVLMCRKASAACERFRRKTQ